MSNLPATHKTPDERLQALARAAAVDTLIKYTQGIWSIAGTPVPAGEHYVAYPDQVSHNWIKFVDSKPVEEHIALVPEDADGDTELKIVKGKSRDDLGDHNESLWERDDKGVPKDPWTYGLGLPMMNMTTGALVVFKASSVGGMGAIAGLVANYVRNKHFGFPVLELSTGSYRNRKYGGFTSYPVFTNVGYDTPHANGPGNGDDARVISINKNDGVTEARTAVRQDSMNDEIPF